MAIRISFRTIPLLAVGAYLAACGSPGAASASDCDVIAARDGSDTAAGTLAAPLKTAQAVADRLEPGQVGCLRAGVYTETPNGPHVLQFNHGGREGAPVTVRSYPGERAKLVGVVWVREGSDDVKLADLEVDGRGADSGTAVTIQMMAERTVVEGLDITNRRLRSCMIIGSNDGWGQARDVTIRRNVFRDCGSPANGNHDHGIYVQNLDGGRITENVFYGSAAWAVQLYPNADRVAVTRNVMDGNFGGVIVAGEGPLASSENVIEHNVITNSGAGRSVNTSWDDAVGRGNVARDNCLDGSGGALRAGPGLDVAANVVAAPAYRDRDSRDYRLSPSSPCREVIGGEAADAIGAPKSVAAAPPAASPPAAKRPASCRRHRRGSRAYRRCKARAAKRAARLA